MDFLSLTDISLGDSEVKSITENIKRFLIDIQHIVNNVNQNSTVDTEYLDKFKLIQDIINLYNNPKIDDILSNIKEQNEMNIWNMDINVSETSNDENNISSENEISSENDDNLQDIYLNMIDREYENIQNNSVLKQNIDVIRKDSVSFNE
jgi:hypothetical protein